MSIETFDWQGYMSDIGYAPEEIPNEINDEDREWLYGLWARDLMEQLNYEARQNPFLATAEEKRNDARDKFLQYAPDLAHMFNTRGELNEADPDKTFDPEEFRQHVINNQVQNADLGYYLDTFAASRINPDTKYVRPWLEGMTKDQFKRSFMTQQDIDEAWTSVDDIREGNFGTLAAAYQAQQAQEAPPKSGHMAALKQGWYEFEKLFGYTVGTLGDAVGVNWLSDIGNEIAENVIKKSDAYNYQSKYNQSLADTIKNEGVMSGAGKILNMAEENWATTAAPLALAAIGKILSTYAHVPQPLANAATNAVAANLVRRQGSALLRRASRLAYASSAALSGLEIGGVRAELEEHEKYDPNNVADVVAAGLVSSSLDFIGNVAAFKGMTITARRLFQSRLTTEAARANLAREIAEDQAKSFTHRVLSAMAVEGITEGLQEIPAMVVGARRGIDYTSKEVRDRIIDAAAVGSFMGGGVRAAEIALEKYHRGDDETPADTEQETPPETPEAPETQPPSPPPPPGFDGQLPLMGMNYYETENGFSVFDRFNVGYGATREEASRDFLNNANKGRVDIDPNNIQSPSPGESVVRYGNNDQHSVRVIGQGSDALIRKIVDLHNDPKNAVNLQGDNVFNVSDFQADDDQSVRSVLEQRKTGRGYNANVIANRENAVDIPVNLGAVNRTDMSGTYAALNLDDATRTALSTKGFVILSNPRSINSGRDQRLLLYRDGFVYTVTLNNGATDENVSASVEAESLEQINKRLQIRNEKQRNKARDVNVKSNFLEAGVRNQGLRTVTVNPVSNTSTTTENKSSITIAPVLRSVPDLGFVEISQTTDSEGVETLTFDPRKILEGRVKKANGKIENIGARGIKYTSAGETIRLDVTADGHVLVSRDGRFVGDYPFVPADIGNGERRASFQSTEIEATQPFHVVDIPEELQFEGRVLFVYKGDDTVEEASREYYAIANNGDVHHLSNTENNYVRRLLRLPYIQNLNDARDVFGNQFVEFYVEPRFDDNGQLVGFQDKGELLYTFDLTDENTRQFADDEVDALIQRGYNKDFIKVWAIVTPDRRRIVRATTQEGVAQFVEDLKGYANVLDQSEWNPSSRAESIFDNSVYNEQGLYGSEDLYGVMYQTPLYPEGVSDEILNTDTEKIESVTKEIVRQMEQDIEALRGERRKGRIHLRQERIDDYQFAISSIKRDIDFSESSTFNYAPERYAGGARELNEIVRRRFYRIRTAQALLHVDLYRNKLSSFTNVINRTELDNILINEIGSYSENLTLEELRERTIQAEAIALRLEEAYINTFRLSDASKTTTLLWNSIYPDTIQGNYGSFVNRIHSEGTDFRFSRNTQTPRVQRRNAILDELRERRVLGAFALNEMLEKGFRGESGGLRILASQEEAHEVERMFTTDATQPYYDDGGLIQGFVAPDGIIYLVEDGIVDGRVRQVLLHEFGVHARKFGMTDGEFQEIIQGLKAKREEQSPDGDFVRKCITRAKEANPKLTEDNPLFWEEVAAYTVEHGYEISDNSVFGRLQAWIKRWLWRFGFIDASVLHYQDLVMFAQGMLNKSGPLRFFDGMFDYTKQQDVNKNITQFSRTILAEDTPEREEFAQRTYRRLRGLDDAIDRERNGESADAIEQATDWRRNDSGNWGIRYSRATSEENNILEEVNRQYEEVRNKYFGTNEWLKIRDKVTGELVNSNLDERQWIHVRTQFFKNWFGDWENNPQNASKVVDEHGEPLVVYHGSPVEDLVSLVNRSEIEGNERGFRGTGDAGIYFSPKRSYAERYTSSDLTKEESGGRVYEMFLNIRNPATLRESGLTTIDKISREEAQRIQDGGYDGIMHEHRKRPEYVIFNSLQVRSATENVGTYGATGSAEFRYSRATTEDLKPYKSFINDLEDNLVRERISGVPREGDTVLYQRGDVNEFITRDSLYTVEDAADYHPDLEQRWIDYHRDDSESNFIRYSRSIPELGNSRTIPTGEQKQADVLYPDASEEIQAIRYSRQSAEEILRRERPQFSDEQVKIVLDELDKYSNDEKKQKLVLHWVIRGQLRLPEDTYKIGPAMKYAASNLKIDPYQYSPQEIINRYQKANPSGIPIRPGRKVSENDTNRYIEDEFPDIFTNFKDEGDGIVSYQVNGSKEGQQAMRKIMNTHWGRNQSPWCLLRANNRGELQDEAWKYWNEVYIGLPKRVAFKNGDLISFMGTDKLPLVIDEAIIKEVEYVLEYPQYYSRGVSDYIDGLKNIKRDRVLLLKLKSHIINKHTLPIVNFESNYGLYGSLFGFLPEEKRSELRKKVEEAIENRTMYLDLSLGDRTAWNTALNKFFSYLDNTTNEYTFKAREFLFENRENLYEIKKQNDGLIVVDILGKGINFEELPSVMENEVFSPTIFYFDKKYGNYIHQPSEKWWDRNDDSHPNLDWARDPSVHGLRYSRATTTSTPEDSLPETPKQRGTAIPNAPGVYRMPDGSLHIEPSELPVGFESETILYAAIAISDPAKEEKRIAELRDAIAANDDLLNATNQIMQERGDTNEDHRLGYGVSLILSGYDPISDLYQLTVDAFHEAVSKATGGAYQNLVLDTSQIEAAAHAIAGMPYEPFQTAPQETVPTPRPNGADIDRERLQQAFDQSDAQRQNMQVGADGRAFISTDDSDVDVVFEKRVTNPLETGQLTDDVFMGTAQYGEADDFYNHLADDPHHGTQEPLDTGRFAQPADLDRAAVENFLANAIPEHIWNRMEILWEDNAENRAILGNALGVFRPLAWQNKNIVIQGWDRSFGQVVRTAAREASRFGWSMWQNRDFRNAFTDFYDTFVNPIYEELRPYYNQMGITDPRQLSDDQKIFMVQTFFSKLNQSLFTDDVTDMGNVLGIDAQEYRRVLANVRRGISTQENDLSRFLGGFAGDAALAKEFAAQMLRMTMETATNIGTHFVYERSSVSGQKDRIRIYTNEWGTWRKKIYDTRFAEVAEQIKKNLSWWRKRFHGDPRAERFVRFMMRNLPMGFWPLKYLHLYVPSARLGDTTLGRASQMIARVWQKIGDLSGTTIAQDYALMEDIHEILREHGYDPLVTDDMETRRQTYQQFFRSLGITSAKAMEKARLADNVVSSSKQLRAEGAANIRSIITETGVSLYERMARVGVPQGDIERMVDKFERKRQRFHDNYQHRMYEAFTPEGKSELARMIHYLERDPVTGEETIAKRARRAREAIDRAEARWGRGTSRFYKETEEARKEVRRYERLVHLQNFETAILANRKTNLVGAELKEAVLRAMKNRINTIILDHQSVGRFDSKAVPHYNYISGQKLPQLNPDNPFHKEYMDFLGEIKDPMRIAVYSADQQRQIIAKLQFNKELGEYLLDNNMASLRGAPSADGLIRDLAQMETGSFLEYVNIDPEFMPEIKAEYENMQKVVETVLGGLVDAVKANSTVYSLRLAMNNYIGNFSMLLASGHFWRFGQWMTAGEIVKKQFLDRFTYGAKDPSDFAKKIIKEMEDAMVTGGSGTEMTVFQLNKGAHENFIRVFTHGLMNARVLTKGGKFRIDNFVNRSLEYARKFYTYGDEWVKPLMYINNRMNAIAKYEAITERKSGETQEEYEERIMRKAIEEASEMTLRETVSWENSPFFIRQLSTKSIRFFVPDFLLHNFQMLRITASNYVRWWELLQELRNFDPTRMNPDKAAAYRSSLVKEFTQRSVGGAMTAGVYAGLAGATGSCMAFIPYMMNTVFAAIDGEDDKDKDKTFFNPQEWEGAQRILNYKTGGDNFFVPAWKHNGKIYAWNYGRASVMLTHAIPHPATDNPEFTDYASQFFKNVVNIGGGTIAQEILNNIQGKDKWGRDIGVSAGVGRVVERVFVPGAVRQLMDMSVGYPFAADNPYREGKAIKMSDAVGITVNAYDMRDIVNEIGWNMGRVQSSSQNVHRKNFVKRLADSDALSDAQVVSLVNDMRESNARDFDKANYVLTGLRQMGMENKDIAHWLTVSRKDANTILSKKQANAFLKGKNIYDENLVTYLKNKRNNLAKGEDDVRMSREELAVVLQNYDKAIRIYSQALRAQ